MSGWRIVRTRAFASRHRGRGQTVSAQRPCIGMLLFGDFPRHCRRAPSAVRWNVASSIVYAWKEITCRPRRSLRR